MKRKAGVYRVGPGVFVVIDYHGERSVEHRVEDGQTEDELTEYLADALWSTRPWHVTAEPSRPRLELVR